ncbi:hypothetical protein BDR03DRAFT_1048542 [Suillus americanus]|nr:hypothetical protein BDR03DRAFT_1048542 [Suillus americanus]
MYTPLNSRASHWAWIEPRNAKKKAMEKAKRQRTFVNKESDDGYGSSGHGSDSEDVRPEKNHAARPKKLCRTYAMRNVTAMFDSDKDLEDKPPNGIDTDADCEESEGEEPEATALMLSDEMPSLVQSRGNNCDLKQSAREQKQAEETPMWHDVNNAVSESVEESTTRGDSLEPPSSDIEVVQKNLETWRVVRDAIIDAKGHIIFVNAYPELVDKNQVSLQSLLTVAENHGIKAIKKCLQTDAQYAALLGSLVEPRIPLLQCDLKVAACANIDSYFRLSNNIVKAKKLMEQHAYVYALRFDSNIDALPIGKKPYQGELLIFLLHDGVFNGAKSTGIRFSAHFVKIARNKAKHPKVPIPLLALVATAIYAALFWKTLGSPGKFNFTWNQFSETYVFHVNFLEGLKKDAPGKFHCMMADIFEAVQALKQKGNDHLASEHRNALSLLDLDGMADD